MIKIDYIYSYATSRHPRGIYKHQQTISPHITTYQLVPFRLQPFQSRRARYGGLCELCQHAEDSEGRVHPVPELGSCGAGDGDNLRAGDVIDPTCFHLVALISRGSSNGGCPSHHASFNIFQYYSLVMVGHPWLGMMWGGHHYPHSTWETSIWMNIINESLGVFFELSRGRAVNSAQPCKAQAQSAPVADRCGGRWQVHSGDRLWYPGHEPVTLGPTGRQAYTM